jgi:hypothetical protein
LLEVSVLKTRHYLRKHNNKEFIQHKLAPAFLGKENQLKDTLNQIIVRPLDICRELEQSGDFIFPFWSYVTTQIKNDIKKKNEWLPEDIAILQATSIIEIFNNYYRSKKIRQKEAETALRNLETHLEQLPYLYTLDEIIRFTDTRGIPLLGQYTQEDLEQYLKNKTTVAEADKLPELLVIHGKNGERWFVKKNRILPLCFKLLGEARQKIRPLLSQRWYRLMHDYQSEPAMENPEAFEKELWELIGQLTPPLVVLLEDPKLYLVHEELEQISNVITENTRLFYKGTLLPLSDLLLLKQKDLLTDVKMLLPFWYSVPILSGILAFFKRISKQKRQKQTIIPKNTYKDAQDNKKASIQQQTKYIDRRKEFQGTARKIKEKLIPGGYTLDSYLVELIDRWNRIINEEAKKNLTEDVNALIRDYLRKTIRALHTAPFTAERIENLAENLVDTPNLQKLPDREALKIYIQLYIVKLLSGK